MEQTIANAIERVQELLRPFEDVHPAVRTYHDRAYCEGVRDAIEVQQEAKAGGVE